MAFNDVELCFHLLREGYQNVCCNQTFLYHHESMSRGFDAGEESEGLNAFLRNLQLYPKNYFHWNSGPFSCRA